MPVETTPKIDRESPVVMRPLRQIITEVSLAIEAETIRDPRERAALQTAGVLIGAQGSPMTADRLAAVFRVSTITVRPTQRGKDIS